ncbi:hypothetical protein ACVWWN_000158 [Mycobacterium sp. URHB0021]
MQARNRRHPSRPPGPGRRPMRVESEYRRHDTLGYLAAYDVHRAHVTGHCASRTGIEPFSALVDKVMTRQPYASAPRVLSVVDNGASHRGWTAAARLRDAFPHARMIHLPVLASWLNQIGIFWGAECAGPTGPARTPRCSCWPRRCALRTGAGGYLPPQATCRARQHRRGKDPHMIRRIRAFGAFWYDFVIGDDWRVALGVVVAFVITFALSRTTHLPVWWIIIAAVAILLPVSVRHAARHAL